MYVCILCLYVYVHAYVFLLLCNHFEYVYVHVCENLYVRACVSMHNKQTDTHTHMHIHTNTHTYAHVYTEESYIHTVYINSCACLIYTSVLYISTYKHSPENIQFTNTNGTHSKMISGLQHCHVYTCIISMYIHASSPCSQQDYISDSPHKAGRLAQQNS
jgi:hypothetical protein